MMNHNHDTEEGGGRDCRDPHQIQQKYRHPFRMMDFVFQGGGALFTQSTWYQLSTKLKV